LQFPLFFSFKHSKTLIYTMAFTIVIMVIASTGVVGGVMVVGGARIGFM
jgi:hypothetical protein